MNTRRSTLLARSFATPPTEPMVLNGNKISLLVRSALVLAILQAGCSLRHAANYDGTVCAIPVSVPVDQCLNGSQNTRVVHDNTCYNVTSVQAGSTPSAYEMCRQQGGQLAEWTDDGIAIRFLGDASSSTDAVLDIALVTDSREPDVNIEMDASVIDTLTEDRPDVIIPDASLQDRASDQPDATADMPMSMDGIVDASRIDSAPDAAVDVSTDRPMDGANDATIFDTSLDTDVATALDSSILDSTVPDITDEMPMSEGGLIDATDTAIVDTSTDGGSSDTPMDTMGVDVIIPPRPECHVDTITISIGSSSTAYTASTIDSLPADTAMVLHFHFAGIGLVGFVAGSISGTSAKAFPFTTRAVVRESEGLSTTVVPASAGSLIGIVGQDRMTSERTDTFTITLGTGTGSRTITCSGWLGTTR